MAEENRNPVSGPPPKPSGELEKLHRLVRNGARCFYWIAGLSAVNSLVQLFGGDAGFIAGLSVTQVIDSLSRAAVQEEETAYVFLAAVFFIDLLIAGVFAILGWQAEKRKAWIFITGMVLYGLDTLIYFHLQDWFGLLFHVFILGVIGGGLKALKQLQRIEDRRRLSLTGGS